MSTQQHLAPDGSVINATRIRPDFLQGLINDPSPSEIAAETAAIRASWSPAERESRRIGWTHFRFSTAGVETAARAALTKRLERRRGAMEALSLIAALRRHAEAAGLERAG